MISILGSCHSKSHKFRYSRKSNLWARNGGPVLDFLHFICALMACDIPNKGTIFEIWHNKAIINSVPAQHVDKAGKTLQSTNLFACLCTNIIYVFIKCEIFVDFFIDFENVIPWPCTDKPNSLACLLPFSVLPFSNRPWNLVGLASKALSKNHSNVISASACNCLLRRVNFL